jgi:hypothetical protein
VWNFCGYRIFIRIKVFIFKIKKFYQFLNIIKFTAIVFMDLRFFALVYGATLKCVKKSLFFLLLVFFCPVYSQNPSSNEDLKKQADKLFKDDAFSGAYKLYSQLVSNFPKDPVYNYRLGVCMIYSEPDKKKCLPYLKYAAANPDKEFKDVKYYLGKACHINYLFDEAIKNYNDYKLTASSSQLKKFQVDREIMACANGKHLLSSLTDLEVVSKTELSENDYFRTYKKIGGKLLVKPDEFKTSVDKKKKEKSVVFLPNGSEVVYFSSFGDNPDEGKDLYTSSRLPNGTYSKPEKVKGVNTEFDEDYPFLHPDGKTLYFASKGHNSMGGYDIFKSVFNEVTNTWGPPINMEFPINSPDDDYLFVTDSLETMAYFSTGRQSPPGKIDVLKVKTTRKPIDIIAIKGNVIKGDPEYELKSNIEVKDLFTQVPVGSFSSEEDGSYSLELPNGGKLLFTVETPGLETQSAQVTVPLASVTKPYKQTISYEKGKLKILNYFDESVNDNTYLQYLKVIEKKAKLDVNEGENKSAPLTTNNASKNDTSKIVTAEKKPKITETVQEDAAPVTAAADPKKGLDNKQLAKMARQDAEESRAEAAQLNRDFMAANETGLKQKEEADKELAEANNAIASAEAITDEDEKKQALEKATALKQTAENDQVIASKILALAKSLDDDAKNKQKESDLNSQYAKELEKSTQVKNNKASLAKLEELQKEIDNLSVKKNESENMVKAIKENIDQKEKQIAGSEEIKATIQANLEEIKTAISDKEAELAKTKKKAAKQNISAQISELNADKEEKEKQISNAETETKTLKEELISLKNELDITNKITSENIVVKVNNSVDQNTTNKSLQEKYKDRIIITDANSKSSIEESTRLLSEYNKDLDQLITNNKAKLPKTKNKEAKQQLTNEIKQSENRKTQNLQQIESNAKKLEELAAAAKTNETPKTTFDPITATSSTEAVTKLDNLVTQLNGSDNENFDYNGYQNPKAQSLKIEADARINDAVAKQKKLKDEIAVSKERIEKNEPGDPIPVKTEEALNQEAEELLAKSQDTKKEAQSKKGAEKERLLAESKKLEEQAGNKAIEAAEVTRNDNASVVSANQENIQNLIKENKSNEEDVSRAKALNEEAKLAFRKASDIRLEANSLGSTGAKLGSFSNAEEKEEEAILLQQDAISILAKSNPGFKLKTPVTSTSTAAKTDTPPFSSNLEVVNTGLTELAAIKIESYQKLYEANNSEIEQLTSEIEGNQAVIDKTPSLKTDLISANNKIESAKTLKQNSDNAPNPNEKLSNLIASIKKQNEAVKQLSSLNNSISQTATNKTARDAASPAVTENTNPAITESTNAGSANTTTEASPAPGNELSLLSTIDTQTLDIAQLSQQDTTTNQVLSYFDRNSPTLRNAQANSSVKNSLGLLKDYEAQNTSLDEELNKASKLAEEPEANAITPQELAQKSDALLAEAEPISNKSQELKKEAEGKEGEDKNYLLAQARELEIQAQDKMIEAADYKQQSNESEYKTNRNAINELIDKLKTDNPALSTEMEAKREEYSPLKTQVRNLRDEANALNNKAAKLGALSNAEEKEVELIQKQGQLLNELKKQYPDYVVKPYVSLTPEEQIARLQKKKSDLQEKQYAELTNLTNAFSLEYESSKNFVPADLTADQQVVKQNADDLNSESKRLLIQSAQENNENEKIKLLNLAAKSGNAAVDKLNKLLPKVSEPKNNDLSDLARIGNQIISTNTDEPANTIQAKATRNPKGTIKIEGLEVVQGNAYSNANPIPMDSKMQDGLVFRVQIGAFKTQLPNNAFKGLSPLNGETTPNGYFRYTAGNFDKIENANAVKNDLRNLGYRDAFVVVYYNGKRISLAEALAQMNKDGKTVDPNAPQTAGITPNVNVPKAAVNTAIQESVVVTKELEQMDGLLYTIQIGVYTKQITKPQLLSLRPIFREQLTNGLYRYTAGIYNNPERLLTDKSKVVDLGIKDAFVSAYLNGKRIPFNEAKDRQATDATLKMEPENPIVFPEKTNPAPNPFDALLAASTVEPFKNNVKGYPASTPDNGVKATEDGVSFKVQIGAFSKQVPADIAVKFSSIKTWPVENKKTNGLFIYNIGNFSEPKFAKALKEEALHLGITDAFITVYRDGRKLYGPEAEGYLR